MAPSRPNPISPLGHACTYDDRAIGVNIMTEWIKHHQFRTWLLALVLAVVTHKLGWDYISAPLTFCVIFAGFIVTMVETVIRRRKP